MADFKNVNVYVDKVEIDDDDVKTYVKENFDPSDVYDSDELLGDRAVMTHIKDGLDPDDVFDDDELGVWAENNEYIKKETE